MRTFSEIAVARGYRVFVMAFNHPYRVIDSDGKLMSKTFAELAVCRWCQARHHKQVTTQEMCKIRNVNKHISGGPKQRNHTKRKFNNQLKDIINNKLQVAVTKNNITQSNKRNND